MKMTRGIVGLRRGLLGAVFTMGAVAGLQASLFVDPTGGTVLFDDSVDRDDLPVVTRPLGFTFNFFGTSHTTVDVSINGNLNFTQDLEWENAPLSSTGVTPTTRARIAPLWDDLFIFQGTSGRIVENGTAAYYSITWDIVGVFGDNSGDRLTFQSVIFNGAATLLGQNFQAGDILFSYDLLDAGFAGGNATVGLDSGDGLRVKLFPGSPAGGVVTDADKALLPLNGGLLFRDDGSNGYNALTITAVPEPETYAAMAGLALVGWGLWRRRQA